MKFMILLTSSADSEAGVMPSTELLAEMGAFNEALVKAGVMVAGEGLQATSKGARVLFDGKDRTVVQGPFPLSDRPVAGFWIWDVASKDEAIAWVKKCPNPMGQTAEIEIRQIFEAADFADADPTGELMAKEEALRAQSAARG
ncbi:MAG TPA: YciI family protein [Caulobacteraceae bacterium]|nr:YciI family protein [Caulobacteraceae bacterium]